MYKVFSAGILFVASVQGQSAPVKVAPAPEPAVSARDAAMTSIERQRQSVERQRQSLRNNYPQVFRVDEGFVPTYVPPADCPPMAEASVRKIVEREAARQKVDARLVQAVVEAESAYSPCAVSPVGALGLMQLMPATADSLQVSNPFDPDQNISAGTQFLKQMLERYGGDVAKSLAAYNAGPGRVDANGGVPPIPETVDYVKKIMGKMAPAAPRIP